MPEFNGILNLLYYWFCTDPMCKETFVFQGAEPTESSPTGEADHKHGEVCDTCDKVFRFLRDPKRTVQCARQGCNESVESIILHFRGLEKWKMFGRPNRWDELFQLIREAIPDDRTPKVSIREIQLFGYPLAASRKLLMAQVHQWPQEMIVEVLKVDTFPVTIYEFRQELTKTGEDIQQLRKKGEPHVKQLRELVNLPKEFESDFDNQDHDYFKAMTNSFFDTLCNGLDAIDREHSECVEVERENITQDLYSFLGEITKEKYPFVFKEVFSLFHIHGEIDRLILKKNRMLAMMTTPFRK